MSDIKQIAGTGAENKALPAVLPPNLQSLDLLPKIQAYAGVMAQAGFFDLDLPKNGPQLKPEELEKAKQAASLKAQAKMAFLMAIGTDMGLTPAESIQGLYVNQNGQVETKTELLKEKLDSHPVYGFETLEISDEKCSVVFLKNGKKIDVVGNPVIWTKDKATKRGLVGGRNAHMYEKWLANMLFKQCIRDGVKFFCPGLMRGQNFEISVEIESNNSQEVVVRKEAVASVKAEKAEKFEAAVAAGDITDVETIVDHDGEVKEAPPKFDEVAKKEAEILREKGNEAAAEKKEDLIIISNEQRQELMKTAVSNGWQPPQLIGFIKEKFGLTALNKMTSSSWEATLKHVQENKPA